jgi:hypothetical protein
MFRLEMRRYKTYILYIAVTLALLTISAAIVYASSSNGYWIYSNVVHVQVGNVSPTPTQTFPIANIPVWVSTLAGVVVILTALVKVLEWLRWNTKYGKCRTPIDIRPSLKRTAIKN